MAEITRDDIRAIIRETIFATLPTPDRLLETLREVMTYESMHETISEAIRQGISDSMPSHGDICGAIQEAVSQSFPYRSEVSDAIFQGTKRALADK